MAQDDSRKQRRRVVVIGAGFAGLSAAKALRNAPFDVIVIDRHNYHLFQPLLYQVATAGLSPADIAAPIRGILRDQKNTTVILPLPIELFKPLIEFGKAITDGSPPPPVPDKSTRSG